MALYHPCFSDGPLSTYQQHCRGLAKLGRTECPHKAILRDLESEILAWQDHTGDEIIVLMDFNEDVHLAWIRSFFHNLNIVKALSELTSLPPTATHNRGSTTIDGIYVSKGLLPSITGGYLAFDAGILSDHRVLWIDIPGTILGFDEEYKICKPNTCQIQCRDPRVVKKYMDHLSHSLEQVNAFQHLDQLMPSINNNRLTREQQHVYEELDREASMAHLQAEKQCQKFKMDKVLWTPDLTKQIYRILYWKGIIAWVLG